MANSLQEVLNRAKSQVIEQDQKVVEKKIIEPRKTSKKELEVGRSNTVLIGGHFSPDVSKQLRIIAAEEGTTNQALLKQALDLLFVKKGKKRIADL